jgi:small subunit ribosomal protein S20
MKRARAASHRKKRNTAQESQMKTLIRRVRDSKEMDKAEVALKKAVAYLDSLANKGVIHKNKASNQKSKLTKLINKMK